MRLALDAMGGDFGPRPNVSGALHALAASPDLSLTLVGDEAQLRPLLDAAGDYPADRLTVLHSPDVVGMKEKPVDAFRKKPHNSIALSWKLVAGNVTYDKGPTFLPWALLLCEFAQHRARNQPNRMVFSARS